MKAAGAIILTKTNLGHTLMMGESVNHLWGRTVNPYNRTLTPGGSSGGEAALLAMRGSAMGVGTDIGGSIRKPAKYASPCIGTDQYSRAAYVGCGHCDLLPEGYRCEKCRFAW